MTLFQLGVAVVLLKHRAFHLFLVSAFIWNIWRIFGSREGQFIAFSLIPLIIMVLMVPPKDKTLSGMAAIGVVGVAVCALAGAFDSAKVLFVVPLLALTLFAFGRATDWLWVGYAAATSTELVAWFAGNVHRGSFGSTLQNSALEAGFGPLAQQAQWAVIAVIFIISIFMFCRQDRDQL